VNLATPSVPVPEALCVHWKPTAYALAVASKGVNGASKSLADETLDAIQKAGNTYEESLRLRAAHIAEARRLDETRAARHRAAFEQCDAVCRHVERILLNTCAYSTLLGPDFSVPYESWGIPIKEAVAQIGPVRFRSDEGRVANSTECSVTLTPRGFAIELRRGRLLLRHEYACSPDGRGFYLLSGVTPQPMLNVRIEHAAGSPVAGTAQLTGGTGGTEIALRERVVRALAVTSDPGSPLEPQLRGAMRHHVEVELLERALDAVQAARTPPPGAAIPGLEERALNDLRELCKRAEALTRTLAVLPRDNSEEN
jgi:hypothetical protein